MLPPVVSFPPSSIMGAAALSPILTAGIIFGQPPFPENLWLLGALLTATVLVVFIAGDWLGRKIKNKKTLFACAVFGVIATIAQPAYLVYSSNRDLERMMEGIRKQKPNQSSVPTAPSGRGIP